jgi:tetrahydromethanopterin S-methyltransferase subunit F
MEIIENHRGTKMNRFKDGVTAGIAIGFVIGIIIAHIVVIYAANSPID